MRLANWNIEAETGYKPKTTFYTDFSIADHFGVSAVKDTFRRAFKSWSNNVVYVTELVMALNWKIWKHYERNPVLSETYQALWEKADLWCTEHLKGEDLDYFYQITD